ncbi:S2-RNase [Pyrus ussuriensis x Pyrus communis]|uniref:S2-RNase n=1 Tax=Pyrus ussuriensis x Pyrus communis TaxID=2448454 RepID=A0A5N5FBD6_9ROSA|nr:S2-RNase [Pyrus ussuriensis x Pyrus communis]
MSSSHKSDDGVPPLYCQGGSFSKVGYFKAAHFKISSDDSFKDFLEPYWHAISSGVRVKGVKEGNNHEPYSKLGSIMRTSLCMKKVHVALGIPAEYCEWHWLLSPQSREKDGLPPREEIKQIKAETLASPIAIVEPAVNEEMLVEKKSKASSIAREGLLAADKLVINLTFSKRKKDEAIRYEPVAPAMLKVASRIAQCRGSIMPLVPKSVPRCPVAIMKSDKVDSAAKVAPNPIPLIAKIGLPTEKRDCSSAEICALLKPNMLEDMDACPKLVDSVRGEMAMTMAAEAYSSAEKIKRLESELVSLKGSNISTPTSLYAYTKDEELITTYNQVIHFKKKEMDELQCVRVCLLEENEQLKGEKARLELGYVDHLFGRPSDFDFAGKDFKTFSISSEYLFAFTFEASIGEVLGEVGAQAGAAGGVPLLFDLFVIHIGEGVTTLAAYFVDLVRTFPDRIHLFGAFSAGSVENCLVRCFGLPIALGIPRRGHVLLDAIFLEELRQIFAYELWVVVCDDGLRDAKSTNDDLSYEALYVHLSCGCRGLCFHPFGEVVSCHDHLASAPNSGRHWP